MKKGRLMTELAKYRLLTEENLFQGRSAITK